ncbi:MAG TPA: hypothetical protein PLY87_26755, partial [Planctomycetaceae bacterium]|nr:hypothetical protein [Planctomycetaceae bacterium]
MFKPGFGWAALVASRTAAQRGLEQMTGKWAESAGCREPDSAFNAVFFGESAQVAEATLSF